MAHPSSPMSGATAPHKPRACTKCPRGCAQARTLPGAGAGAGWWEGPPHSLVPLPLHWVECCPLKFITPGNLRMKPYLEKRPLQT